MQNKQAISREIIPEILRRELDEILELIVQFQRRNPKRSISIDLADEALTQYRECILQRALSFGDKPIEKSNSEWVELEAKIKSLLLQLLTKSTVR